MLRRFLTSGKKYVNLDTKTWTQQAERSYCERKRRKGDGTKADIFEERAGASQSEYFRKKTAHQLEKLREKLKNIQEDKAKGKEPDKNKTNDKDKEKPDK